MPSDSFILYIERERGRDADEHNNGYKGYFGSDGGHHDGDDDKEMS